MCLVVTDVPSLFRPPGEMSEDTERSQQLRILLQLQPPVQPHRVRIRE